MRRSIVTFAALLCAAAPASAAPLVFECPPACSQSDGAGEMQSSKITFGDGGLQWDATFSPNNGRTPDAFWAVFTGGPRPREAVADGGLAILYGDASSETVWAYEWDPDTSRSSWRDPANLIETYSGAFTKNGGQVYLELPDISAIQTFYPTDWQGLGFNTTTGEFGVSSQFFSGEAGEVYSTGPDGKISDFDFVGETSYGRHYRTAQPIPEPHAIAAFTVGLAVVGWGVARARRSAAPAGSGS
jgi:hypothetical protein